MIPKNSEDLVVNEKLLHSFRQFSMVEVECEPSVFSTLLLTPQFFLLGRISF